MIRLAELRKERDADGTTCYKGQLGNGQILLLRNEHKQAEEDADLILYLQDEQRTFQDEF